MTAPASTAEVAQQHEFVVPCEAAESGCGTPAAWVVWFAHAAGGCGITALMCDEHKEYAAQLFAAAMCLIPPKCVKCGQSTSRLLSDNVKWIPL